MRHPIWTWSFLNWIKVSWLFKNKHLHDSQSVKLRLRHLTLKSGEHNMGVVIEPENEESLAETILFITKQDMDDFRKNARFYAENYLNKKSILEKILSDIK